MLGERAPDTLAVERFRADLVRLIDVDRDRLLVAVSGGADSTALLLLAHAALGDRCLAATVDHGLRAASADEAARVATWCRRLGVEHTTLRGKLPDRVGRTANLSTRARAIRYSLLEGHADAGGARWVATGHHADDQLETLVMRLNRGAGVSGLAGIRERGGRIVRPLLRWRRAELDALVAAAWLNPVDDPTNRDERYDRARLRRVLADASWLDADQVAASARALGDAEEALAWAARALWAQQARREGDVITLHIDALPFELRRRCAERAIRELRPEHDLRGEALIRIVEALDRTERATLADVLCDAAVDRETGHVWTFRPAPRRRGG